MLRLSPLERRAPHLRLIEGDGPLLHRIDLQVARRGEITTVSCPSVARALELALDFLSVCDDLVVLRVVQDGRCREARDLLRHQRGKGHVVGLPPTA